MEGGKKIDKKERLKEESRTKETWNGFWEQQVEEWSLFFGWFVLDDVRGR